MGSAFSNSFGANRETKILLLGISGAGKTTILRKLKLGDSAITIIPTIGFNVKTTKYKGSDIYCFDLQGACRIRELWNHYFQNSQGIVFVVDSADGERIEEAKDELFLLLKNDELRDCVLLVYASKQDLPNAIGPNEMSNILQLNSIKDRPWKIQGISAQTGDGIYEGLDWLDDQISMKTI
ncbi:ADP-ribosylation factor 1 [Histomonas meleagridis]|uniref:ADP-ribosylation factor 1 n=1 Tax=Histomonas meleagridis TaxID=135588 RepID=UPI0035596CF8|nr:ADP-ribosylation factor 1 [Histomonas meleagridis]KAH0799765.1 ADP-ribosylation factor 1 [Histomonas meleagridis]